MRNRREDVMYLTLVDFFMQMVFLVMISLMAYIYLQKKWVSLAHQYQLKDDTELQKELQSADIQDFKTAMATLAYIKQHGGFDKIKQAVKKMEEGQGKPPCVIMAGQTDQPKSIATFATYNNSIQLLTWQPELENLARQNNITLQTNMSWPLKRFYSAWHQVLDQHPDCRYTVTAYEHSQLVTPRDRLQSVFYVQIRR
jgi:hypothetical protein